MPRGDWIQSFLGNVVYPLDPDPSTISIIDIGHALSNQCRFLGHTESFYSVAQHCLFVSEEVPPQDALWGLLHDASEAYLSDVPRPLKKLPEFEQYRTVERLLMKTICEVFGLPLEQPQSVTHADLVALATEVRDLMAPSQQPWDAMPPPSKRRIVPLTPKEAEKRFLDRFWKLRKEQCHE